MHFYHFADNCNGWVEWQNLGIFDYRYGKSNKWQIKHYGLVYSSINQT